MTEQERKSIGRINSLLLNAKRSINEAITLGMAMQSGVEPPEDTVAAPPAPAPRPRPVFRPTSPNRDAAMFGPPDPLFMKPSRMRERGRHGSRRRR